MAQPGRKHLGMAKALSSAVKNRGKTDGARDKQAFLGDGPIAPGLTRERARVDRKDLELLDVPSPRRDPVGLVLKVLDEVSKSAQTTVSWKPPSSPFEQYQQEDAVPAVESDEVLLGELVVQRLNELRRGVSSAVEWLDLNAHFSAGTSDLDVRPVLEVQFLLARDAEPSVAGACEAGGQPHLEFALVHPGLKQDSLAIGPLLDREAQILQSCNDLLVEAARLDGRACESLLEFSEFGERQVCVRLSDIPA